MSRQIGNASTPPNSLNRTALPSITGSAACGTDVAEPEHGRAVADDGDGVLLDRQRSRRRPGRPRSRGRRAPPRACTPSRGRRASSTEPSRRPRACRPDGAGRFDRRPAPPRRRRAVARNRRCASCARASPASTVTSRTFVPLSTRTRSIASSNPSSSAIVDASAANAPGRFARRTRSVALNCADGWPIATTVSRPVSVNEATQRAYERPPRRASGRRAPIAAVFPQRNRTHLAVTTRYALTRTREAFS